MTDQEVLNSLKLLPSCTRDSIKMNPWLIQIASNGCIGSAEYVPHGQKSEKPSHQRRRRCCCEAVHSPHPDVVRSGQNRSQSHHAGYQCEIQERGCNCIACRHDNITGQSPLSIHSSFPKVGYDSRYKI